ncbi:MAG: DUF928 domain-containing protein [Synechococcales bacterium]|nr:DUF928 domain-containing protein [Synechococcales bacterium]
MKRLTPFSLLFMLLAIVGLITELPGSVFLPSAQATQQKAAKIQNNKGRRAPADVGPPNIGRNTGCILSNGTAPTPTTMPTAPLPDSAQANNPAQPTSAARRPCLTALIPLMEPEIPSDPKQPKGFKGWYGGQTMQEKPVVWVYVGYAKSEGRTLKLELYDQNLTQKDGKSNKLILSTGVNSPQKPGFVAIQIPQSLKQNHWYRWQLIAYNGTKQETVVGGLLYRVEVDPKLINQPKGLDKAIALNNDAGIWYDSLNEIMALKQTDNPNVDPEWEVIMKEILNLERIKAEPIAP